MPGVWGFAGLASCGPCRPPCVFVEPIFRRSAWKYGITIPIVSHRLVPPLTSAYAVGARPRRARTCLHARLSEPPHSAKQTDKSHRYAGSPGKVFTGELDGPPLAVELAAALLRALRTSRALDQ
ncbi:hypothetical protein GCM10023193_82180 [Planotetraspora kaengkrachanensis]|uniref:Uncharacterized protein n=1 Tax=Planotetraspora kaengkrachanensis TaxID=575193 RepID=A0A8J3Q1K1_9ACTN|nr:hypothetical protein Pka01_81790 [Planotetraspora kaengkrachanensis]